MVQAIEAGTKTQTRRIIKPQSAVLTDAIARNCNIQPPQRENQPVIPCPYGQPGDLLWVRETFSWGDPALNNGKDFVYYRAQFDMKEWPGNWRPSIHMPKKFARIWLQITDVRAELLQDISEYDAIAEGIAPTWMPMPQWQFEDLWESIHGPGSWAANPVVWVINFRKYEMPQAK
jgi:hypothetical protein